MKKLIVTVMTIALFMSAGSAMAASTFTTFDITANVAAACNINSMQNMNFGAYDPTGGDVNATADLQFNCSKNTAYDITIEGPSQLTTRQMTGGTFAENLVYELYYDGAHTTAWADVIGNILGQGTTPDNTLQTMTVYGQIAGGQDVSVDSYTQTLEITVNF